MLYRSRTNLKYSYFFCLLLSAWFIVLFVSQTLLFGYAESFSLYSSVGINDTNTRNLIAIYQNSPDYDPFYEFEVARVGQYDYRIFYGKDISNGEYKYFSYYGINQGASGIRYYFGGGSGSNLYLDKNGYVTVGNVENSLRSSEADSFRYQYVMISCAIILLIFVFFRFMKKRYHVRSGRGWEY